MEKATMLGKILERIVGLSLDTLRILYDLVEKLSGDNGAEWFAQLKNLLRKEPCWIGKQIETIARDWPIWKTIKIGTGLETADDFREAHEKDGHKISNWADDILKKIVVAAEEAEIDLATATVKELTGKDSATTKEIFDAIVGLGGELCPAEVGPQLRLQYGDQPKGEWLLVAMEPITDSAGDLSVFGVVRFDDGESWLNADYAHPGAQWGGDDRWVFRFPRK